MVAGRLLALVAVACLHVATAFVCYGCPRLVLRDQLHAGQPLSRHMQNNLWPAEPMRRHRAAPASKRRCAIMSVGEHVDDSRTVDGSGSFDPVCVVSPHDAGTPVLWVLPSDEAPPVSSATPNRFRNSPADSSSSRRVRPRGMLA